MCRKPTPRELELLKKSFDRQKAIHASNPAAVGRFLKVGESPRDESIPIDRHAALASVCLGLFNLDEAMTRE